MNKFCDKMFLINWLNAVAKVVSGRAVPVGLHLIVFNKHHLRSCRSSLLGLLAKIMCSICSCQLNIWHVGHCLAPILNCFLILGSGKEACFSRSTDRPGPTLPPGSVHQKKYRSVTLGRCDEVFRLSSLILRLYVPV